MASSRDQCLSRPAATAVIVAGLLDPAWLVEIEAEALLPS